MAIIEMDTLADDLGVCMFENGRIHSCDYHGKKVNATLHKLEDSSGAKVTSKSQGQKHRISPDLLRFAKLFDEDQKPAGGWYHTQEQRLWLERELMKVFRSFKKRNEECRLLTAGVASFVHYYTYLEVVISAAKKVDFPLTKLQVDVVDKCIFPIAQIAAVENILREKFRWRLKTNVNIFEQELKIQRNMLKFLNNLRSDARQIKSRIFLRDLRQLEDIHALGKYDVITEHFLTSMFKKNPILIEKSRESYQKLINDGGAVLVAAGIKDTKYYNDFIKLHESYGMVLDKSSEEWVWDPYGLAPEVISTFETLHKDGETFLAPLDNLLAKFVFRK